MGLNKPHVLCCNFFIALFVYFSSPISARNTASPSFVSNHSQVWTPDYSIYDNGIKSNFDLLELLIFANNNFVCGFFCNGYPEFRCMFGIVYGEEIAGKAVVWSANMNQTFEGHPSLTLTPEGDLALIDGNQSPVWHTDTAGKSVARVELTDSGNLVLFDRYNRSVWESFQNSTDVLVPGQYLRSGENSLTSQGGGYSLQLTRQGRLSANIKSDPTLEYFSTSDIGLVFHAWFEVKNEPFPILVTGMEYDNSSSIKYVKLEDDGHVTFHSWKDCKWNVETVELFQDGNGCRYPSICGKFGVCSNGGHCSCPKLGSRNQTLFESVGDVVEEKGCAPSVQITCGNLHDHTLLELKNVTYFLVVGTGLYMHCDCNVKAGKNE